MQNPITPTVGRTVLFVLPMGSPRAGEIRPATIVRVNQDSCNLRVHLDGPNDVHADHVEAPWRGSVSYKQPEKGSDPVPGSWHWMDYQLQTARGLYNPHTGDPLIPG